jgi:CRISPR-associated endonuclease Csn1
MMILGLTVGTSTIGWALLDEANQKIVAQGVRAFPAGTIGDIETGRDVARNQQRQDARMRRVQLRRRAGRLKRLFCMLQGAGFLPEGTDRHAVLEELKISPYLLRAKALDEKLDPHDLGRAIYHLAHRRGFKSGRRHELGETEKEKEKELGVIKQAIADLEAAIVTSGARTLGEYLYTQPSQRRRWTGRSMYVSELDAILTSQSRFQTISLGLRRDLAKVVFDQKPLKSQKGRVGRCSLEKHFHPRMQLAHPLAQEFRILQQVNDLRAVDDLGADTVALSAQQRQQLIDHLQANGDATFAEIRKVLGLSRTVRFNFERADKKTLVGDRTRKALGGAAYPVGLVEDLLSIAEEQGLAKRLAGHWGLSHEVVSSLLTAKIEQGYLAHSHKAVTRLLPFMRTDVPYATAVKEIYGLKTQPQCERLPLVSDAYPYLANPLVSRSLSELRKLIHAIIDRYGKPEKIRIELHRHLQMGPKSRKSASKGMFARHTLKKNAADRICKEMGITDPTPWQIDRVLLADECGWRCPFSSKPMSWRTLMGGEPSFDVVHLVPFGMSLDDGWNNKTLAHVSVLERRGASLLSEIYPDTDGTIEAHFRAFQESAKKKEKKGKGGKTVKRNTIGEEKLRRFKLTREEAIREYEGTYAERYMESSSYAARTAAEYLSRLGISVEATRGRVSAYVREAVGLSRVRREIRGDYRTGVLDAVSVALASPKTVRALCTAAKVGDRRRFAPFELPWESFVEDVTAATYATVVSFRVKNRVRGPLHEQTNNGYPKVDVKGTYHLVRKSLASITRNDIEMIAGPQIREVVLKALGDNDPKKWFSDPQNLPIFHDCQVRRVRVVRRESTFAVGHPGKERYVTTEQNHHALVLANGKGWTRKIVSLYDAQQRLAKKTQVPGVRKGVLSRDPPIFQEGVLTIAPGEIFAITNDDGAEELVRVRSVSKDPRVSYVKIQDSRTLKEITATKGLARESVEQLRQRGIRKVFVDVLGNVRKLKK